MPAYNSRLVHMKALNQCVLQVDVAQFCGYDTKTDQVADKRRNAQLLLSVDETDCELGVVGAPPTFRPKIPTSGGVSDDVAGPELVNSAIQTQ